MTYACRSITAWTRSRMPRVAITTAVQPVATENAGAYQQPPRSESAYTASANTGWLAIRIGTRQRYSHAKAVLSILAKPQQATLRIVQHSTNRKARELDNSVASQSKPARPAAFR